MKYAKNPILVLQGNQALTNQGCVVLGYRVKLPELFSLESEDIEIIQSNWNKVLHNLGDNMLIQRLDFFNLEKFNTDILPTETYFQKNFKTHFDGREKMVQSSYLFFIKPTLRTFCDSIQQPFSVLKKEWLEKDLFATAEFRSSVNNQISFLKGTEMFTEIRELTELEMIDFPMLYFNRGIEKYSQDIQANAQASTPLIIGDVVVGGMSINDAKELPNQVSSTIQIMEPELKQKIRYSSGFGDCLGYTFRKNHILSTLIFKPSPASVEFEIKQAIGTYNSVGKFLPFYDKDKERLQKLLTDLKGAYSDRCVVKMNTSIFFFESNQEDLDKTKELLNGRFSEMNIKPHLLSKNHLVNTYQGHNPFFTPFLLEDDMFMSFSDIPPLFINTRGGYKEDKTGIFFTDLYHTPIRHDLYDLGKLHANARNMLIVAETGGGKSVTMMEIVRQFIEDDTKVVVIELGASMKKMCEIYAYENKASFIAFEHGKNLGIDFFNRSYSEITNNSVLDEITKIVFAHFSDEYTDTEFNTLRNIILFYVEETKRDFSFHGFIEFILSNEKRIQKEFEEVLTSHKENKIKNYFDFTIFKNSMIEYYTGKYNYLYDMSLGVDYGSLEDKQLIAFDLDKAKDDKRLISILLIVISSVIDKNVLSDRNKKGYIFLDEFAKLLHFDTVVSSTEYLFQAARKYNAGVGVVLQDLDQFPPNKNLDKIIISQAQICIVLESKTYKSFIERRGIKNPIIAKHLEALKNRYSGEGIKYGQFLLIHGNEAKIMNLELSRKQLLAYATDGNEEIKLREITKNGKTIYEAIEEIA